jgi:ABC-type phosphate transport system substrate-binding protein
MRRLFITTVAAALALTACVTTKSSSKPAPASGEASNVGSTDPAPAADPASNTGTSGKRKPKASEVSDPSTR